MPACVLLFVAMTQVLFASASGKQIYERGESGEREITAVLRGSELDMPAKNFPCAGCHGTEGQGKREAGLTTPPIVWETLNERYDAALFARAVRAGVNWRNQALHPAMPSYNFTDEEVGGIITHLKSLSTRQTPGVSDTAIKVGSALPLSGPLADAGKEILAALDAAFAEVNARGGIYGRRIELVTADSRGDSAGALAATRRLVQEDRVFALAGSFQPVGETAAADYLEREGVALIGPAELSPPASSRLRGSTYYLLPDFGQQARALADYVESKRQAPVQAPVRIAVFTGGNKFDSDALAGLKARAGLHGMQIVLDRRYERGRFSARDEAMELRNTPVDWIFFFGDSEEIERMASATQQAGIRTPLATCSAMLGPRAFSLEPDIAKRLILASPVVPGTPALDGIARAAALVVIEAAKRAGRQLTRSNFVESLQELREFRTGVMPPLTFDRNRRVGSAGAYIVRIDSGLREYTQVTDWIEPR